MGKIIKSGVEHFFGGSVGGGSDIEIVTQSEYDELVNSGTMDLNKYYFITDENSDGSGNSFGKSDIVSLIYPVGSIYMSVNATSPATLFGGTWEQIKDTFLLSAGDTYAAGSTGGEAMHTLTVDEMPSHNHKPSTTSPGTETYNTYKFQVIRDLSSGSTARYQVAAGTSYYVNGANPSASDYGGLNDIDVSAATTPSGNSQSHNNMPPYLTVYMWKRTA